MTLIVRPGFNGMTDADAIAYVNAVEAADGQLLEFAVGKAINDFVVGCKLDGIWSAIKASCILAGARTLAGALVPLAGPAPTNNNFVSGDYNRKTGLVGDGSTKYLNTNYAASSNTNYLQNTHVSVHRVTTGASGSLLGVGGPSNALLIFWNGSWLMRSLAGGGGVGGGDVVNLLGTSRASSSSYTYRFGGSSGTVATTSTANTENVFVFARNETVTTSQFSSSRIDFYSIGEALDLALLDTRVTTLITAFGAAIP